MVNINIQMNLSICCGYSKVSLLSTQNACFKLVNYKENIRSLSKEKTEWLGEQNLLEVVAFWSYKNLRQDINNIKIRLLKYRKMVHMN